MTLIHSELLEPTSSQRTQYTEAAPYSYKGALRCMMDGTGGHYPLPEDTVYGSYCTWFRR